MGAPRAGLAAFCLALATGACRRDAEPATARAAELPAERGDRHARAAARRPAQVHVVVGRIARAGERRLSIRPPAGPEVTLRVGPRTAVTVAGRRAGPEALREGAEVRASYRTGDGAPPTAISVEVPAAPPPPVDDGRVPSDG